MKIEKDGIFIKDKDGNSVKVKFGDLSRIVRDHLDDTLFSEDGFSVDVNDEDLNDMEVDHATYNFAQDGMDLARDIGTGFFISIVWIVALSLQFYYLHRRRKYKTVDRAIQAGYPLPDEFFGKRSKPMPQQPTNVYVTQVPPMQQPADGTQPAAPADGGQQSGISFSVTAGQTVVIKDSSGSEIFSGTAAKNASHIIFCSDKLTSDGSYTLYVDGTAAVTSTVSDGAQQGTQTQPADDSSPQGDESQQEDGSSESETKPDAPAQTSVTSFSCTQTAIRINWTAVDGASGYRVYRYNSKLKKYERIAVVDASVLTFRDSGLTAGTKYKYKVIACASNSAGTTLGKASTPYTAATKALRPAIKKTKSSSNAVRLYWSKVKCTGYKIQQYDSSTGKWKTVKIVSSKTTNAAVSGLSSGTSYKFRIVPFTRTSGKTVTGKVSKAVKASTK
jgi:hypothetical protein